MAVRTQICVVMAFYKGTELYIFLNLRCEGKFAQALKDYSELGSKKDGVSVNVGDMELHEFNKLLEVAAEGLKR